MAGIPKAGRSIRIPVLAFVCGRAAPGAGLAHDGGEVGPVGAALAGSDRFDESVVEAAARQSGP